MTPRGVCVAASALALMIAVFGLPGPGPGLARASGKEIPVAELQPGDWIEVTLLASAGGAWRSREVDRKERGDRQGGSLTGPLEWDADGRARLLGLVVVLDAATTVKDSTGENIAPGALADGQMVEARVRLEGGHLVAGKLRACPAGTEPEIEGPLESRTSGEPTVLRLLGLDVTLTGEAVVRQLRRRAATLPGVDDDDFRPTSLLTVGPIRLGATAGAEVDPRKNYDLNSDRARNVAVSNLSGTVEAFARVTEDLRGFAKGGYRRRDILRDDRGTRAASADWQLEEAWFVRQGFLRPELALQVGRQDFDEPHEWLYDENLDAVRLHWLPGPLHGAASLSTRLDDRDPERSDRWNAFLTLDWAVTDRLSVGGYRLRRSPRDGADVPTLVWTGVRLLDLKVGRLRGWGELSSLEGRDGAMKVRARAAHVSTSSLLSRAGRLTLNAAWARGSGDDRLSDGVDGNFRQTGLQDNNDRFGGVTGFRYYGELFRPELSNLTVTTLGLGARPTPKSSVDLVWHRYRQVTPRPFLRDSDLDAVPLGLDPHLGDEIDLVVGVREIRGLRLEGVVGVFRAGSAFEDDSETAVTSRFQMDISF